MLETRVLDGFSLHQINVLVALIGAFVWTCIWHYGNYFVSEVNIGLCFMVVVDLFIFYNNKRHLKTNGIIDCGKALAEVPVDGVILE